MPWWGGGTRRRCRSLDRLKACSALPREVLEQPGRVQNELGRLGRRTGGGSWLIWFRATSSKGWARLVDAGSIEPGRCGLDWSFH